LNLYKTNIKLKVPGEIFDVKDGRGYMYVKSFKMGQGTYTTVPMES